MACALVALYKFGKMLAEWLDEIEERTNNERK